MRSIEDFAPAKVGTESPNGLHAILQELQSLKISIVQGTEVGVPLAVPGITAEDTLVGILSITVIEGEGSTNDYRSIATIFAPGQVLLPDHVTTGGQIIVVWYDRTP